MPLLKDTIKQKKKKERFRHGSRGYIHIQKCQNKSKQPFPHTYLYATPHRVHAESRALLYFNQDSWWRTSDSGWGMRPLREKKKRRRRNKKSRRLGKIWTMVTRKSPIRKRSRRY
jgi:hypothetical protein